MIQHKKKIQREEQRQIGTKRGAKKGKGNQREAKGGKRRL